MTEWQSAVPTFLKTNFNVVSVEAGVNLELTYFGDSNRFFLLKDAVQKGLIKEDLLRERLKPLFYTRFKLGQFDPPSMNPYSNISMDSKCATYEIESHVIF